MKVSQADIIEVMFPVGGRSLPHPALVINNQASFEVEQVYICVMLSTKDYNEDFVFTITPEMLSYPSNKKSFAKCQMIDIFKEYEVIQRFGKLKKQHFEDLLRYLNQSVFSFNCKP